MELTTIFGEELHRVFFSFEYMNSFSSFAQLLHMECLYVLNTC